MFRFSKIHWYVPLFYFFLLFTLGKIIYAYVLYLVPKINKLSNNVFILVFYLSHYFIRFSLYTFKRYYLKTILINIAKEQTSSFLFTELSKSLEQNQNFSINFITGLVLLVISYMQLIKVLPVYVFVCVCVCMYVLRNRRT